MPRASDTHGHEPSDQSNPPSGDSPARSSRYRSRGAPPPRQSRADGEDNWRQPRSPPQQARGSQWSSYDRRDGPRYDRGPHPAPLPPPDFGGLNRGTGPSRWSFRNSTLEARRNEGWYAQSSQSDAPPASSSSPGTPSSSPVSSRPPRPPLYDHSSSPTRRSPAAPPFVPGKPTAAYMAMASVPSITYSQSSDDEKPSVSSLNPLLILLDLNGTLLYRPKGRRGANNERPIHPRPYLRQFVEWLMWHESKQRKKETMIWSSAQPANVDKMVEVAFGFGAREESEARIAKLKAVWARDTLGLSESDYRNKVQTVKNLDTIFSHPDFLASPAQPRTSSSPSETPLTFPTYSPLNTLLIDDSPLKAHMQPFNHIVLREYGGDLFAAHKHVGPESDQTLLAVIGILGRASLESNVANWIKNGGLGLGVGTGEGGEGGSATPGLWYEDPQVFEEWVRKGKEELHDAGISLSSPHSERKSKSKGRTRARTDVLDEGGDDDHPSELGARENVDEASERNVVRPGDPELGSLPEPNIGSPSSPATQGQA